MRISDWSSDVCSSDLIDSRHANEAASPTGPLPVIHVDDSMPPAVTVPPEDSQSIPEVIVTASYREQSNQDVVGSTQVFSGAELDKKGAAGLKDYLLEVPNEIGRAHV